MARSIKKGPYVEDALMTKVSGMNGRNEKRVIKTWARASTIVPDFVGHTFAVHNGNKFIPVYVTENMPARICQSRRRVFACTTRRPCATG